MKIRDNKKTIQKDSVYFGSRIAADQKRLVGVVVNLSGKADPQEVARLRKRAAGYRGMINSSLQGTKTDKPFSYSRFTPPKTPVSLSASHIVFANC